MGSLPYRFRSALRPPLALALAIALLLAGCEGQEDIDVFPQPGNATESASVVRQASEGPIVATFASYPLRPSAPPDGVRAAMLRSIGRTPCSAASFYYSEKALAERWIGEQVAARRRNGLPVRLILAGHGLGGAEAADTARDWLEKSPDAQVVLLVTVDAVKTVSRLTSAASVTGTAIAKHLPGVNMNFIAYDSAPTPDGVRFLSHTNYYQRKSEYYNGVAMAGAENHLLDDWTGLLNHASADDFAMPMVTADFRYALRRAGQ